MTEDTTPLLVKALRGEATPRRPVWLMRQAGRYLPGYRAVKERVSFLELCRNVELSIEVSLEPVERFGVDGCIVFSDILIPLEAMGLGLEFDGGPNITTPVRDRSDVERLVPFDPGTRTPWILESIAGLVKELGPGTPVLGFAGAPFTLASYAVEGRLSKEKQVIKGMRWRDPGLFRELLDRLAAATISYLAQQARAGASALQLFDSWAGSMTRDDWETFCAPTCKAVFDGVRAELGDDCPPLVLYSNGTAPWIERLPLAGADAYSVDWRLPLGEAAARLEGYPIQGNLDPTALHGTPDSVRAEARKMLDSVEGRDGIVANLGHGVIVKTPPENVAAFVDEVQGR